MEEKNHKMSLKNTFGIEIEFQKASLKRVKAILENKKKKNEILPLWYYDEEPDTVIEKPNGVLLGGEVIPPILRDTNISWQNIDTVCNVLKKQGALITEVCGGHIHIGMQAFRNDAIAFLNFLKLWATFEQEIAVFFQNDYFTMRKIQNLKANFMSEVLKYILNEYDKPAESFVSTVYELRLLLSKYIYLPHSSLNFKTGGIEDTLEIRLPNGTLEAEIWQNNIYFLDDFIGYCRGNTFDADLINYFFKKENIGNQPEKMSILLHQITKNEEQRVKYLKQYIKKYDANIKCKNLVYFTQ